MRPRQPMGGGIRFGGMGMTPAVKGLLIANAAVFLLQTLLGGGLSGRMGVLDQIGTFIPHLAVNEFQIWRFITYMFLHGGFGHIAFNMFGLWMFGSQIEAMWGRRTFLTYYFICGLGGSVLYGLFNLVGIGSYTPMLGASAAIFGILLAYGMTFPNNVILLMMIIPMKAKYAVMLFGVIELLSIPGGGGIAHLAHLGGMVAGFIFLYVTMPSSRPGGLGQTWQRFQTKRKIRVVRPNETQGGDGSTDRPEGYDGAKPGYTWDPQNGYEKSPQQERIDQVLDKISKKGLQSLTDEEQEILRRAGKR
ncbi:MAG: rhomboid family intramembrane serine protease [Gemmatimonadales bacterium]|nr:rhomboid family intramembrane serine protease [Gemmatimonadales bacterium]